MKSSGIDNPTYTARIIAKDIRAILFDISNVRIFSNISCISVGIFSYNMRYQNQILQDYLHLEKLIDY